MSRINGRNINFALYAVPAGADEHYDPTSDNAQSGKAVAEAVAPNQASINAVQKKLSNVCELLKGYEYSVQAGTSPAYTQTVPTGSQKYAELGKIGGKSIAWNQKATNSPPLSRVGVTITKNETSYSSTFNGTTTGTLSAEKYWGIDNDNKFKANHVYYIWIPIINGSYSNGVCRLGGNLSTLQTDFGSEKIISIGSETHSYLFGGSGVTFDNLEVRVCITDLTQLFGSGNEPSEITDERILVIRNYFESHPEYDDASIVSGKCDKIISYKADTTLISEFEIPQDIIQNLNGYGWSAGGVYNYIDFVEKKFHKRVGRVDLGSLNYTRGTSSSSGMTYYDSGRITNKKNCTTNHSPNDLTAKFVNTANNNYPTSTNWNTFVSTTDVITFYVNGYNSSEEFKAAMSGQYLYYELANEEVIDVSNLLTDDNYIETEAGGAVTFNQQNDIKFKLPNTVNYMIRLEDAI